MTQKHRNSNIELLRIILICMVITLHYLNGADWGGGALGHVVPGSFNYYASHFMESVCIMAVDTFVLITGYFSCNKTSIALAKPVKLYGMLMLYGIIFSAVWCLCTKPTPTLQTIKFIANTIFYRWFVVIYCVLYVLIPFLNKLIYALTQKQLLTLLIINAVLFYALNTFSPWTTVADAGYGIVNFVCLYLIGAYIRLYRPKTAVNVQSCWIRKGGSFLICVLFTFIFSLLPHNRAYSYLSIFNLISAVALFELFREITIKHHPVINNLASYTFAVYIIHGTGPVPPFLYRKLFHSNLYWDSPYMLLNMLVCVLSIYGICVGIEFLRRCLFAKIWDKQIDKISYTIECK